MRLDAGAAQEAVRDCREALRADPAFWKAALRGGQASMALGRFEEAAALLETAQALSGQAFPEAAQAARLLGEVRNAERLLASPTGDGERALACARSVAAETPRALGLRVLLVRALVRCGRYEEALPLCKELRSASAAAGGGGSGLDAAAEADLQLAYARALAGVARLADALARYRDLLRMDPDNAVYRDEFRRVKGMQDKMAEGDDAMRLQRFGAARRCFAEAMALDPANEAVAARMRAGRARAFQLQRKEALECEGKLADAQREAREAEEAVKEAQKRLVQVQRARSRTKTRGTALRASDMREISRVSICPHRLPNEHGRVPFESRPHVLCEAYKHAHTNVHGA